MENRLDKEMAEVVTLNRSLVRPKSLLIKGPPLLKSQIRTLVAVA